MTESLTIQGRRLSPAELQDLRQWVGANPHWSRWRLSRELATRWDWRNGAGQLKDMAARTLLVKLEQRGLIALAGAAAGADQSDALRGRRPCESPEPAEPIAGALAELEPLSLQEVSGEPAAAGLGQRGAGPLSLSGFWRGGGRKPAIRGSRWSEPPLGLPGVRSGGLEVPGPGPVYRLVGRADGRGTWRWWPTTRVF